MPEHQLGTADGTLQQPRRVARVLATIAFVALLATPLAIRHLSSGEDARNAGMSVSEAVERYVLDEPEVTVAVATGGWYETAVLKLHGIGLDATRFALANAGDAMTRSSRILSFEAVWKIFAAYGGAAIIRREWARHDHATKTARTIEAMVRAGPSPK